MTSVWDSGTCSGSRPLDRSHGAKSGGRRVEVGTASTRSREAAGAGRLETCEFVEGWILVKKSVSSTIIDSERVSFNRRGYDRSSPKLVLGRMDHFPPVAVEEPGVLGFIVDSRGDVGMVFGIVKRYHERPEVVGNGLLRGCGTLLPQDEPFEGDLLELVDHLGAPAVVLAEIGLVWILVAVDSDVELPEPEPLVVIQQRVRYRVSQAVRT
jgi:hypothetical protein